MTKIPTKEEIENMRFKDAEGEAWALGANWMRDLIQPHIAQLQSENHKLKLQLAITDNLLKNAERILSDLDAYQDDITITWKEATDTALASHQEEEKS